jgi:vancomycin resistance protein YoaR
MTSRATELARAGQTRLSSTWPLATSFLLTTAAVLVFGAAFALAYTHLHDGRVVPGVSLAGVSLAGLDRTEAEARLRQELPAVSSGSLIVEVGGQQSAIDYHDFGRDYNMALMLDQAMSMGRAGGVVEQLQDQLGLLVNGVSLEPSVTWDAEALAEQLAALAAAAAVEPVDADLVREGGSYTVVPSSEGRQFDAAAALEDAAVALGQPTAADATVTLPESALAPAVSTADAQAALDTYEQVAGDPIQLTAFETNSAIGSDALRGWTRLEPQAQAGWLLVTEREPISQYVAHFALEVDQPAQDATFEFNGETLAAVPAQEGRVVDVESTTDAVMAAIDARSGGGGEPQVLATVVTQAPEFGTEEAEALAARVERLSRWRTNYQPGSLNYNGANIRIPTDKINGTVLQPGETFDFWQVVGYPRVEDGYGQGAAIIRGRTVTDGALAGGICSCSTTLFNAALRAGLEMGARRNHYYYITRYPRGLDATVWLDESGRGQTVSFTNDMDYPILIRGINRRAAVVFEIWGIPDGRSVDLSRPRIENRRPAYEVYRYTNNLAAGKMRRVEYPASGFESWVTRIVRDASGQVLHEETFYSRYARILGITLLGRYPTDPPHGTVVRVEDRVPPPSPAPPPEEPPAEEPPSDG